jgi:ParB family chromosome partitioning protein
MSAAAQGRVTPENTKVLPLSEITPSLTNAHTGARFKRGSLAGLAASIRADGIIQPLLVRPINDPNRPGKKYEIVAGERRYRAAELAELAEAPCVVTELCAADALQVQLVENLQREGLHPLDEAKAFYRLQKESELTVAEIAARVGKTAPDVARRLSLNSLVKEAKADYRAGFITLGHALEICRLSPDVQRAALAACYETNHEWSDEAQEYVPVLDKSEPRTVEQLKAWLRANVHLNLNAAPFKTTDASLREDGLTCVECPNRTGYNKTLFADVKGADTCLVPACYQGKVQTLVQIVSAKLTEKRDDETPAPLVSPYWNTSAGEEGREVLPRSRYEAIEDEAEGCEYAEWGVYVEGQNIGQKVLICREPTCKDHLGRVRGHASVAVTSSASVGQQQDDSAKRNARKQELFDIKVDEEVRLRVFTEALKTFSYPLDRTLLDMVAVAHFRRIPSDDQKTIIKVFGLSEEDGYKLKGRGNEGVELLARESDDRVAQFMVLCSIAHFGANQYKNRRVSQEMVTSIAQVRGVNHRLIDAQVRHERSAKKYKSAHAAYLAAVEAGRDVALPVVYETPQTAQGALKTSAGKEDGQRQQQAA